MAMTQAVLSTELQSLGPAASEAVAIANLTSAYATYCEDAQALSPILSTGIDLGIAALELALVGMEAPGASAAKIASGLDAFWVAVALGLLTSFAGALPT